MCFFKPSTQEAETDWSLNLVLGIRESLLRVRVGGEKRQSEGREEGQSIWGVWNSGYAHRVLKKCILTGLRKKRKLICRTSGTFCRNQVQGSTGGLGPGCGTRLPQSTRNASVQPSLLCLGMRVLSSSGSAFSTDSDSKDCLELLDLPGQGQVSTLDSNIDGQMSSVCASRFAQHSKMRQYLKKTMP